jgi:hypothetical protein
MRQHPKKDGAFNQIAEGKPPPVCLILHKLLESWDRIGLEIKNHPATGLPY